jgi:predicted acylesterase/phospholipase RssA
MSRAKVMAAAGLLACVLWGLPSPGRAQETAAAPSADAMSALRHKYREKDQGLVREVRLALVCYGGSSLAIYMHGNTKELHHLVQASKALQIDDPVLREAVLRWKAGEAMPGAGEQGRNLTGSARQWYDRLLEVWATDPQKVRTRVVIDIIAGTSAGGINGVILAKALAHDVPEDELTRLWLNKASLARLTNGYLGLLRVLIGRPPVDGDALVGWLYKALASMDGPESGQHSLLPEGDRLDLFVTTTDRFGYPQNLLVGDPVAAAEKRNRHVLHFIYPGVHGRCGPGLSRPFDQADHFCPAWTPALAFAARASSSIPGVFPPLQLEATLATIGKTGAAGPPPSAEEAARLRHDIVSSFFRNYQLQQPDGDDSFAEKTYFVDGGVLDNHPFGPALEEVFRRPQDQEVRRFLVYLQPDPGRPPAPPPGTYPRLLSTIWAGLSGIPSGQPILDNLDAVADHNANLGRIRNIVDAEEKAAERLEKNGAAAGSCETPESLPVAQRLGCALDKIFPQQRGAKLDAKMASVPEMADKEKQHEMLKALRKEIEDLAGQDVTELASRSYTSLRVYSVLAQFVSVIANERVCNYPPESAHRALVAEIIRQWAEIRGLIGTPQSPGGRPKAQRRFLEDFDVGYQRRQLRFVIDWVNTEYTKNPDQEERRRLDKVKAAAAEQVERLTTLIRGTAQDERMIAVLHRLAAPELFGKLNPWPRNGQAAVSLPEQAKAFVDDPLKLDALDAVRNDLGDLLRERQDEVRTESYEQFRELTRGWDDPAQPREILVRYLGFPFWDRQIYPYVAFSDVGEFREVGVFRLSPDDATLLGGGPAATKLKGATKAHFGAFLSRRGREEDYLWGRLDAGERILKLLELPDRRLARKIFTEILAEEQKAGLVRSSILEKRRKAVAALPQ